MEMYVRKLPLILVGLLATQCVYYIMSYPFFSFSDEQELVHYFLTGQFPWHFFPSTGRVYPFSLLEYYPLAALPVSVDAKMFFMYCVNAVKVVLFLYTALKCMEEFSDSFFSACSLFILYVIFLKYDFVDVVNVIAFAEFSLSILLFAYIYLYILAKKEDSFWLYVAALVLAVFALFFKEPVFIIFMTVGGSILFAEHISRNEKVFLYSNIALSFTYVIFYVLVVYPQITDRYGSEAVGSWSSFVLSYLKVHPFGFVGIAVLAVRLFMVLRFKKKFLQFDAFLAAGVLYALAFVVLKMHADYYFIPSLIFIYVAMVGYAFMLAKNGWIYSQFTRFRVGLCVTLCLSVMVFNYIFMSYSIPYTLKKMTKELVFFLQESHQAGFSVQPVFPDAYHVHPDAAQVVWRYAVLGSFYKFYATDADAGPLEATVAEIGGGMQRTIYIVPPQKNRSGNKSHSRQDFVNLGGVFVDMEVHKDFVDEISVSYCKFVKHMVAQGIRTRDASSVFDSGKELQCSM